MCILFGQAKIKQNVFTCAQIVFFCLKTRKLPGPAGTLGPEMPSSAKIRDSGH